MPAVFRNPWLWLVLFLIWAGVLWYFSSKTDPVPPLPDFPHQDKVQHFGYFFGGGGLLSAFLYCRSRGAPRWRRMLWICVAVIALVGLSDEIHQTMTPGRNGNDPLDWLADVLGGFCGAVIFRRLHWMLGKD